MITMPFDEVVKKLVEAKAGFLYSHNNEFVKFVPYKDEFGDELEIIGMASGDSSFVTKECNNKRIMVEDGNKYHMKFLEGGKAFPVIILTTNIF